MADLNRLYQEAEQAGTQNIQGTQETDNTQATGAVDLDSIWQQTQAQQGINRAAVEAKEQSIANMIANSATQPSPTSLAQNLILSFAANDESRMKFLAHEFSGSNIELDPERGIMIDGVPVNPRGFDSGDIARNAGEIFPFLGQVLGELGGGALAGGTTMGVGTVAGMVGGGVAGATLGEGIKLAVGDILGLDIDGRDAFNALTEEAGGAAFGEALGLGMVGGGKLIGKGLNRLGRTRAISGIADIWKKAAGKGGDLFPVLAQFVGGVDPNATKVAQRFGFAKSLTSEFFDPDKTQKVVKRILFGDENIPLPELGSAGRGLKMLARSIKEVNDNNFDDFLVRHIGLTDDTVKTLRFSNPEEIFSSANLSPNRSFEIAERMTADLQRHTRLLGEQIGAAEGRALRNIPPTKKFGLLDIGTQLERRIQSLQLNKGIKVKGLAATEPPDIRGIKELIQLKRMLGSELVSGPDKGQFRYIRSVTKNQAVKLRRQIDLLADDVFNNKKIGGEIKSIFKEVVDTFRPRYYNYMNIGEEVGNYRAFQDILEQVRISPDARAKMETMVRQARSLPRMQQVLDELPTGSQILKDIDLMKAGDELLKSDAVKMTANLEAALKEKAILDINSSSVAENQLRAFNEIFKTSPNRNLVRRAFMDEAEMSLAAKEFLKGTPNILRVSAITSMLGIGGILGGIPGVPAALAALPIALTMTKPSNIAKFLVKLDQMGARQGQRAITRGASAVSSTASKAIGASGRALLNQMIQQQRRNNRQRTVIGTE